MSEQRYKPYGEVRWSSGAGLPTDPSTDRITGPLRAGFTFTSQRAGSYGTIFMSAREYLPSLGRFLSADSIVPGAGNPQALNRYAYVFNSPLGFVDPSGHDPAGSQNNCNYSGQGCGGAGSQTDIETQHIILAGTQWWYDRQSAQSCADHAFECGVKTVVNSAFMVMPIGLVGVAVLPTFLTSYAVAKATVAGVAAAETVVAACGGECSEEIDTAGRVARTFQTFETGLGQTRETILSGGQRLILKTGHAFERPHVGGDIRSLGLTVDQVESAIAARLEAAIVDGTQIARVGLGPVSPTELYITVNGARLAFRVVTDANGKFLVPTYFPPMK